MIIGKLKDLYRYKGIAKNIDTAIDYLNNNNDIFTNELKKKIMPLIRCNNLLANKYSVVATNPPYMNDKYMG